jgi:hypothetical protein
VVCAVYVTIIPMLAPRSAKNAKSLAGDDEPGQCRGSILSMDGTNGGFIQAKGENVKTFIRSMVVAAVAAAFVLNVSAADGAKTPKGKGPVVVAGENAVMTCPKCKDDYLVKTTRPPKGTESEKAVIANHLCEKCSTKLVVKGEGKAKTDVAVHTCKGCK